MKRPKKFTQHVSYRIAPTDAARIASLAKGRKTSEAEIVRMILELTRWDELDALLRVRYRQR